MKFITESDDEAEPSQAENFFLFLHRAKAHHRFPELYKVFNTEFPFNKVIETNRFYLEDQKREYAERVCADAVLLHNERYVHISNFSADPVVKRKLNRCLEKLPSSVVSTQDICPAHSKRCRLVSEAYGFLCYLHLLVEDSEPDTAEIPSSVALLEDEEGDEEVAIDLAEERALVLSSALSAGPTASTITPDEDNLDNEQGDFPLASFPSFPLIENLDFVLLIDIMHSFNIREDYCLAAIASFSELEKDFVEDDLDHFLLDDSAWKDSEFRPGTCIIKSVFDEWKTCEASLPSDEEHTATTKRLGFEYFGKFLQPVQHEDSKSAIDIWRPNVLENDENQQVLSFFVTCLDSFYSLYFFSFTILISSIGIRYMCMMIVFYGELEVQDHPLLVLQVLHVIKKMQHYRNTSKTSIPKRYNSHLFHTNMTISMNY